MAREERLLNELIEVDKELGKIQAEEAELLTWKTCPGKKERKWRGRLEDHWAIRNLKRANQIESWKKKVPIWKNEEVLYQNYQISKKPRLENGRAGDEADAGLPEVAEHPAQV